MKKILIVVDMQHDFIYGPLGTPEAREIVPNVWKKIDEYHERGDDVYYTLDAHFPDYLKTHEGRYLPILHCMIGSEGRKPVCRIMSKDVVVPKRTFGYGSWAAVLPREVYSTNPDMMIEIVGVCTDICVVSNALILRSTFPEIDITVDASCCAGTTPEKHKAALEVMKSCHIDIINE